MKEFAQPDRAEKAPADLNRAVAATLVVAANRFRGLADLETQLGELPLVRCYLGELNQAVLQLLVNAGQAIEDSVRGPDFRGRIRVRTACEGAFARIDVEDNGCGIPGAIRERIFEPFFTTKEVGRGRGQGLCVARAAVVDRHGGTLTFESEPGHDVHRPRAGGRRRWRRELACRRSRGRRRLAARALRRVTRARLGRMGKVRPDSRRNRSRASSACSPSTSFLSEYERCRRPVRVRSRHEIARWYWSAFCSAAFAK